MEESEEKSRVKIAEVIARERKNHNLTQKELGDLLHISPQAVSKWEKELAEPDVETILKMCEIFGITPNEMYGQPQTAAETAADAQTQPTAPEQGEKTYRYPRLLRAMQEAATRYRRIRGMRHAHQTHALQNLYRKEP